MGGAGSDSISVARRRKNAHTASGSASSRRDSELRISSSSFWLVRTPMSAVSSTFSISSTTDGSICFLPREDLAQAGDEAGSRPREAGRERGALARRRGARERDDLGGRRARARARRRRRFRRFAGAGGRRGRAGAPRARLRPPRVRPRPRLPALPSSSGSAAPALRPFGSRRRGAGASPTASIMRWREARARRTSRKPTRPLAMTPPTIPSSS